MNHERNGVLLTNEVMSKYVTRHLVQYFLHLAYGKYRRSGVPNLH